MNYIMKNSVVLLTIILLISSCLEKLPPEFKVYLREGRYNDEVSVLSENYDKIGFYRYLGGYTVDPKTKGEIDVAATIAAIESMYPEEDATGFLAINLEGELYKSLKNYPAGHEKARFAIQQYQLLVKTVKEIRPGLDVGIYGFPFSFYYDSQRRANDNNKLDPILEICDYISPSLYSAYPNKEVGAERNQQYLAENLVFSLEIGQRLGKPVIPYVWHIVHPSNKDHGGEVLSVDEMAENLKFISNFKHNGNQVKGVIWWESSEAGRQALFDRTQQFQSKGIPNPDASSLIMEYLDAIRL